MFDARGKKSTPDDEFLVPQVPGCWGKNNKVNKDVITLGMAQVKGLFKGERRDELLMSKFLKNMKADVMRLPVQARSSEYLPAGAPIIDFVRALKSQTNTWEIPDRKIWEQWSEVRNLTERDIETVEIREIRIGESTEAEIQDFID